MKLKTLHYLFSRKNKWGSKLISWTSKKCSGIRPASAHVALLINERWVFESTYKNNVSIMSYEKWKELNIEDYKVKCIKERDYSEIKDLFKKLEGKKYDWFGIVYFGWRLFLKVFFKAALPKINKLQRQNSYFCCEVVGALVKRDYTMHLPVMVYEDLTNLLKS